MDEIGVERKWSKKPPFCSMAPHSPSLLVNVKESDMFPPQGLHGTLSTSPDCSVDSAFEGPFFVLYKEKKECTSVKLAK